MIGIFFNMGLYDENASCHLALGQSIPQSLRGWTGYVKAGTGLNISMIHIDFMIGTDDLAITGITQDGKEVPVFIDGDFAEPFKVS